MLELFEMGGPLFMGILSVILLAMLAVAFVNGKSAFSLSATDLSSALRKIGYIKAVGLFAFVMGLLGQLIGLFSAFSAMALGNMNVSLSILANGFKVSMISTLYGLLIYAISIAIWFGMSMMLEKK